MMFWTWSDESAKRIASNMAEDYLDSYLGICKPTYYYTAWNSAGVACFFWG